MIYNPFAFVSEILAPLSQVFIVLAATTERSRCWLLETESKSRAKIQVLPQPRFGSLSAAVVITQQLIKLTTFVV